jgi:hypothetical protein
MTKRAIFAALSLAVAMVLAAPSKASAGVVVGVGVRVGPVVARPAYVVAHPRPYAYGYYSRPVVVAPAYAPPVAGFYYRGRWCPRPYVSPYVNRGYYSPRYYRR